MKRNTYRQARICPICRTRNTEHGQRGARLAHYACRKLVDHGYRVAQVRAERQQEAA